MRCWIYSLRLIQSRFGRILQGLWKYYLQIFEKYMELFFMRLCFALKLILYVKIWFLSKQNKFGDQVKPWPFWFLKLNIKLYLYLKNLFFLFSKDLSQAYKYLANFYLKKIKLDNAYEAASKCLELPEVYFKNQIHLCMIITYNNVIYKVPEL